MSPMNFTDPVNLSLRCCEHISSCDFSKPEQYFSILQSSLYSQVWIQIQKRNKDNEIEIIGIRQIPCQWPLIEDDPDLISCLESNQYIVKPIGKKYYVEKYDAAIKTITMKWPLYIFGHLNDKQIIACGNNPDCTPDYRSMISVVETHEKYSGVTPTSEATKLIRDDINKYRFLIRSLDIGLSAVIRSVDLINIFYMPEYYTLYSFHGNAIILSVSKIREIKKRLRKRYGAGARFDLTIRLPKDLIKFAVGKDGKDIIKAGKDLGCNFSVVTPKQN